jgi:hypothetical protein
MNEKTNLSGWRTARGSIGVLVSLMVVVAAGACGGAPTDSPTGEVNSDEAITNQSEALTSGCSPGSQEYEACMPCGTQTRSCNSNRTWGPWGSCQAQGVCYPGTTEQRSCGPADFFRFRTCTSSCAWGPWSGCLG